MLDRPPERRLRREGVARVAGQLRVEALAAQLDGHLEGGAEALERGNAEMLAGPGRRFNRGRGQWSGAALRVQHAVHALARIMLHGRIDNIQAQELAPTASPATRRTSSSVVIATACASKTSRIWSPNPSRSSSRSTPRSNAPLTSFAPPCSSTSSLLEPT